MFKRLRLRRVHAKFLESCRNLKEGREYWGRAGPFRRWFLEAITPIPILSLHEEGKVVLEALRWLEENCSTHPVDEETLCRYHRMILKDRGNEPGDYRKTDVSVFGSAIARPSSQRVSALMKQLEIKTATQQRALDLSKPVDAVGVLHSAISLHQRIAFIHPFNDGNGRVARLAMNHLLRRYGLGYVIFPPVGESQEHFDALEAAHRGDLNRLMVLAKQCVYRV